MSYFSLWCCPQYYNYECDGVLHSVFEKELTLQLQSYFGWELEFLLPFMSINQLERRLLWIYKNELKSLRGRVPDKCSCQSIHRL